MEGNLYTYHTTSPNLAKQNRFGKCSVAILGPGQLIQRGNFYCMTYPKTTHTDTDMDKTTFVPTYNYPLPPMHNSIRTHPSAFLQGPSSVHPFCATDCLQQVGFGVPPEHHFSLHLPIAFCLLHSGGWEEGCVITPSRYLQPPAMGGPTVQSRAVALTTCAELCNRTVNA